MRTIQTLAYDSVFTRKRWNEERAILVSLPWNPFFNGLIDTFVDERNLYYVLELAPVGSLHKYLREYGPVTDDAAQFYFANIVLGLEFLHSHNIVHRDLKPGNILMGGDGYLSLGDFGAAAHVDETGSWAAGTPEYQMPELLRKEAVPKEQRMTIDWWSAAVCLYEIVARKVPFYGTDERILAKAASGKIMWGHQVVWHPDLKDLLTRMLGAERYGSTTYQAPSDEIPLNHELRSHDWVHDLNWTKIAQRREAVSPRLSQHT
ncbi:cAMP dependent protein kinase [Amylocystis lapponica]|nr:cAMP dependent protein kinase [Amylocystis lapponica]